MNDMSDNRAIVMTLSFIFATAVVIVIAAFSFYQKVPWYASFFLSLVVYPSALLAAWGDEVVNIIKTIADYFFKGKES
jgi:hypothetical protein